MTGCNKCGDETIAFQQISEVKRDYDGMVDTIDFKVYCSYCHRLGRFTVWVTSTELEWDDEKDC